MNSDLERQWEVFFESGFYARGWEMKIDSERTRQELEGVIKLLNLPEGAHVLDWCGGWGRHAIELAKRGFKVTMLDFAANHIEMAKHAIAEEGVELRLVHADFRHTPPEIQADFAVNMFTAGLGYLTEADDVVALKSLHAALKPGAKLLIDTMNLFWLVKHYQSRGWDQSSNGKVKHLAEREFDFWTNRNHSREILLVEDDGPREVTLDHRIYSAAELVRVLESGGFRPIAFYGGFDGSELTFDKQRMVIIADRM